MTGVQTCALPISKFNTAFESFGVNTKANQADDMVENYKVDGVPTLTVDGKYVVLGNSFEQILQNADAVIAMARAEKAAGGPVPAVAPAANHK